LVTPNLKREFLGVFQVNSLGDYIYHFEDSQAVVYQHGFCCIVHQPDLHLTMLFPVIQFILADPVRLRN
jgi:hypothetical protein